MNRIMANQASPLNSQQVNNDLIANDQAFTKKASKVVQGLTAHNAGNRGGPPNVPPVQSLTDNGVTYNVPTALVEAFKKDHPNAR